MFPTLKRTKERVNHERPIRRLLCACNLDEIQPLLSPASIVSVVAVFHSWGSESFVACMTLAFFQRF